MVDEMGRWDEMVDKMVDYEMVDGRIDNSQFKDQNQLQHSRSYIGQFWDVEDGCEQKQ